MRSLSQIVVLLCFIAFLAQGGVGFAQDKAAEDRSGQPDAEQILRSATEFLAELDAYSCEIKTVMAISSQGLNDRTESTSAFRLQRPNRLAMVGDGSMRSVTIISDGETLIQYIAALSRYSRHDAPDRVDEIPNGPVAITLAMLGPGNSVLPVGGPEHLKGMLVGVTESKYLGIDKVDEVPCHRCEFVQQEMTWVIAIQAGDRPLIRRLSFDVSEQMRATNAILKDAEIEMYVTYSDWDFTPKFAASDFHFSRPDDATEVDDLFGGLLGGEDDDSPHPLLGKPAPTFMAKNLDTESVEIKEYFGQDIVILDFWATWCGPCVEALPVIAEVADKYADRGVRFFAVNVGEEADEIKGFLKDRKLDLKVLLDIDGKISNQYQANAIPQTVLVGKSGMVEVVHVGLNGDLAEQLSSELDSLLKGEELAKMTLAKAEEKRIEKAELDAASSFGTKQLWSANSKGLWSGVCYDDQEKASVAVDGQGTWIHVDLDGKVGKTGRLSQGGSLRLANLIEGGLPEMITFGTWGQSVRAYTNESAQLWDYSVGDGIDDVWPADLDGDGQDEVIIGFNGGTGLHVLDQRGKPLWKYTQIGNVWHVTGGDVDGDGIAEVVTTSAEGIVHLFDAVGKKKKDITVPIYASFVRLVPGDKKDPAQRMLIAGSSDRGETLLLINDQGTKAFSLVLPSGGTDHVDDIAVSKERMWAAVAMRGGLIHVVDLQQGTIIASVAGQGFQASVSWHPRDDASPLLVVATGSELNGFEVERLNDRPNSIPLP